MECLNCGAPVLENGHCSACGMNYELLAKAYNTSNFYYNLGLDRARVRDLTGAIDALNSALKYNKQNINARNLLGLIYYEMGETVLGLTQWVISSNYLPEHNIAAKYIQEVQTDSDKLDEANQLAKQYNQALTYAKQGTKDLAFLQLKRILAAYPHFVKEKENMRPQGVLFILTVLAIMPIIITLFCDLRFTGTLSWSGYAIGGILIAYAAFVLPLWFSRPNPVIFVPIVFALLGVFLLYINLMVNGDWFLSLAFPAVGILGAIATTITALMRYIRGGRLYIFGSTFIAIGAYCLLLEFFIDLTFGWAFSFIWSPYPFIACLLSGLALIVIAISRPLRESLHRKLFI